MAKNKIDMYDYLELYDRGDSDLNPPHSDVTHDELRIGDPNPGYEPVAPESIPLGDDSPYVGMFGEAEEPDIVESGHDPDMLNEVLDNIEKYIKSKRAKLGGKKSKGK
jgi:hypothetical protein